MLLSQQPWIVGTDTGSWSSLLFSLVACAEMAKEEPKAGSTPLTLSFSLLQEVAKSYLLSISLKGKESTLPLVRVTFASATATKSEESSIDEWRSPSFSSVLNWLAELGYLFTFCIVLCADVLNGKPIVDSIQPSSTFTSGTVVSLETLTVELLST